MIFLRKKGDGQLREMNRWISIVFLSLFCLLLCLKGEITAQSSGTDLFTTGKFRVAFEGVGEFPVAQVKGLVSETLLDPAQDPSKIQPIKELKPVHLVIVRKAKKSDGLWRWREAIISGKKDLRAGRVDLLNQNMEPVLTWEIIDAWPFKWVWPELDANAPEVALETIHFMAKEVRAAGKRVIPLPKLRRSIKVKKK